MSRLTDAERDGITDRRRRLKKACVSREGSIIVIHQYFDLSHVRNGVPDIINSDDEHFYRQAPNDIDALLREVVALEAELAEARSRLMHVSLHPHKPYSKCTCGAWNDPGSCGHHPSCPLKATEG